MRILGVDPGTITGYGVIEGSDDEIALIDCGVLVSPERSPIGERLSYLYNGLLEVIARHQPDAVAVEQPFMMARNVKSALVVGRVQAVALLAAANRGLPSYEYTPTQVKQRVTNYGASSKEQIQEMVRLQLGLSQVPQPNDVADALAVAICHLREIHLSNLLARQ